MTFGSLFAGIGGLDLGFERAGMECKWQVEIDDYANRVLKKHWPDVRRHRDIRTFPPEPVADWRVDCVCGGFPCQDISYAGKGAGLAGERSGLFHEAMRVIRVVEPKCVVLENVAALRTRGLDQVLGSLASLGFSAEWHCIPAAAIGAPHIRDRVFVLACSDSWERRGKLVSNPICEPSWMEEYHGSGQERSSTKIPEPEVLRRQDREAGAEGTRASSANVLRGDRWWAIEPSVGRMANGVPRRMDRLRCLGNAVVPQVAEWIGRQIVTQFAA